MRKSFNIFLIFSVLLLSWSCSSAPRFTSEDNPKPQKKAPNSSRTRVEKIDTKNDESEITEFHNVSILESVTGTASYYGKKFHGNLTSNGEIFDMYGLSAAHPTYPEGTIIKVTNLSNGKSVMLKINDRMPKHPDRIIDLSYGAAKKLDMLETGLAKVRIDVLKWGDGEYKK